MHIIALGETASHIRQTHAVLFCRPPSMFERLDRVDAAASEASEAQLRKEEQRDAVLKVDEGGVAWCGLRLVVGNGG